MDTTTVTTTQALTHLASIGLAMVAGRLMKRSPKFRNGFIPVYNFLLTLLVQSAASISGAGIVAPASASTIALAWSWSFLPGIGEAVLRAALDTFIATGIHGSRKNVTEALKQSLAEQALEAAKKARRKKP